mmetsp:Transcript_50525/g.93430  ORF Transcript_50525/g.93430 Transcript_50525/m.93430 type:complete len:232 (+) Transcript_50525:1-696(+)
MESFVDTRAACRQGMPHPREHWWQRFKLSTGLILLLVWWTQPTEEFTICKEHVAGIECRRGTAHRGNCRSFCARGECSGTVVMISFTSSTSTLYRARVSTIARSRATSRPSTKSLQKSPRASASLGRMYSCSRLFWTFIKMAINLSPCSAVAGPRKFSRAAASRMSASQTCVFVKWYCRAAYFDSRMSAPFDTALLSACRRVRTRLSAMFAACCLGANDNQHQWPSASSRW